MFWPKRLVCIGHVTSFFGFLILVFLAVGRSWCWTAAFAMGSAASSTVSSIFTSRSIFSKRTNNSIRVKCLTISSRIRIHELLFRVAMICTGLGGQEGPEKKPKLRLWNYLWTLPDDFKTQILVRIFSRLHTKLKSCWIESQALVHFRQVMKKS